MLLCGGVLCFPPWLKPACRTFRTLQRGTLLEVHHARQGAFLADNTQALIHTFITNLQHQLPAIRHFKYDFNRTEFIDTRTNMPVDWEAFTDYRRKGGVGVPARAGEATARRGIFIQSLLSSEGGERPRILEQVLHRGHNLATQGSNP